MTAQPPEIKMTVTLSPVTEWDATFVEVNAIKRGIIRPNTHGGWVAERMGCYKTNRPDCVFGYFAGKQEAIEAIVEATKDQPPYIVYPKADEDIHTNWAALGIHS